MKKLFPTALGLNVAIAITAGAVLIQHPLSTDSAPRAYSDIIIAEADNQKVPTTTDEKGVTSPPQQTKPSTADVPPAVETTPGEESKGKAPTKP
jgi:hypothetical protein